MSARSAQARKRSQNPLALEFHKHADNVILNTLTHLLTLYAVPLFLLGLLKFIIINDF
jgi:hypothetical protein